MRTARQMERQLGLGPVVSIPELDLSGAARGRVGMLPDLRKQVLALPRFVMVAGGLIVLLLVASAIV